MKRAVERKNPKNLDELEEIIDEIWNDLTLNYIKTLIRSIKNRIQSCIILKGEKTEY